MHVECGTFGATKSSSDARPRGELRDGAPRRDANRALIRWAVSIAGAGEARIAMPKGPNGERRPADANACAVKVAKIATGELDDERYTAPGRRRSGAAGAEARKDALSQAERAAIAR